MSGQPAKGLVAVIGDLRAIHVAEHELPPLTTGER